MIKVQNGWQDRALTDDEHAYALQQARNYHSRPASPRTQSPKHRRMSTAYDDVVLSASTEHSQSPWSRPSSRPGSSSNYPCIGSGLTPHQNNLYGSAMTSPNASQKRPKSRDHPGLTDQNSSPRQQYHRSPEEVPHGSITRLFAMSPPTRPPRSAVSLWEQEQDAADTLLAMGASGSRVSVQGSGFQKSSWENHAAREEQRVDRLLDDIRNEEL